MSTGAFEWWEGYGGKEWTFDPLGPYLRKSATYHDDASAYPKEIHKIGARGSIPIAYAELILEI